MLFETFSDAEAALLWGGFLIALGGFAYLFGVA